MRRYFIKTYGCAMNVSDSSKIAEALESFGFAPMEDKGTRWPQLKASLKGCSIILINTCVVREHAENKALGFIGALSKFKKSNPDLIIGVCGCMAAQDHIDLKTRFPFLDLTFGPNELGKLKEFLASPRLAIARHPSPSKMERGMNPAKREKGVRFVTIMTGCDNFCSYCVVPYVRGRETSRPMDEVLEEIKGLSDQGIKDITLLGQNVNSYKFGLKELLKAIEPAAKRRGSNCEEPRRLVSGSEQSLVIRFMTSHPRDMSDELIQTVKDCPHVAKDFHLPLQAGDDEILKKMNRGYTIEYFCGRVKKIKELIPEATITTDIIVGFPGETEEQFNKTLERVREFRFNAVNMAAYSLRPQTSAAKMPGHLPEEIKQDRLRRLKEVVHEVAGKNPNNLNPKS